MKSEFAFILNLNLCYVQEHFQNWSASTNSIEIVLNQFLQIDIIIN